jgi:hypothetical protein
MEIELFAAGIAQLVEVQGEAMTAATANLSDVDFYLCVTKNTSQAQRPTCASCES